MPTVMTSKKSTSPAQAASARSVLSWRIGAYRQPLGDPACTATKETAVHGLLIPQNGHSTKRNVRPAKLSHSSRRKPSPEPPMMWISPVNETANEAALFHYYGETIPSLVYGLRKDPLWCPVRAMSMPCGFMYPSQFRWMLIMSETHQSARRGIAPPPSLYKRKAAAYQQLNSALADPKQRTSFETILSVNAALYVEARIVGPEVTKLHLKALDQLYVARNKQFAEGTDSFAALLRLSVYTAYLMCECETDELPQLLTTARDSQRKLTDIQSWVVKMQHLNSDSAKASSCSRQTHDYAAAKSRLVQHPAIAPLTKPPAAYLGYSHIAMHFSVLLLLNLSLFELGPQIAVFFIDRLLLIVDNSMAVDAVDEKPLLKLPALPMMMAQARLDVLHNYTRSELGYSEHTIDESRETRNSMIDALKMFSYLGDQTRKLLINTLFGWLQHDASPTNLSSEGSLRLLEAEVGRNWKQQNSKAKGSPGTLQ